MPKAILEFNLPEEQVEFDIVNKAGHYSVVIEDLDNYLRNKIKYSSMTDEEREIYEEIRTELNRLKNYD